MQQGEFPQKNSTAVWLKKNQKNIYYEKRKMEYLKLRKADKQ